MKTLSALALALVVVVPVFAQQRAPDYPKDAPWPPLCNVVKFEGCVPDEALKSKPPSQPLPAEPKIESLPVDIRRILDNAKTPAVLPPTPAPSSAPVLPTPQQIQEQIDRQHADLESQRLEQQRRDMQERFDQQRRNEIQQQNYAAGYTAGYAVGEGVGNMVGALLERHRVNSFCKKHPAGWWRFSNGSKITCAAWNARSGR